jgi:hypothetical protein
MHLGLHGLGSDFRETCLQGGPIRHLLSVPEYRAVGLPAGMFNLTACVWIGMVMISMISSTNITSISGVVLMSTITSGSPLPPVLTFMPIVFPPLSRHALAVR